MERFTTTIISTCCFITKWQWLLTIYTFYILLHLPFKFNKLFCFYYTITHPPPFLIKTCIFTKHYQFTFHNNENNNRSIELSYKKIIIKINISKLKTGNIILSNWSVWNVISLINYMSFSKEKLKLFSSASSPF